MYTYSHVGTNSAGVAVIQISRSLRFNLTIQKYGRWQSISTDERPKELVSRLPHSLYS